MFGFKEDSVFNVARFDSDMTVWQLCSVLEHLIDSGCGDLLQNNRRWVARRFEAD